MVQRKSAVVDTAPATLAAVWTGCGVRGKDARSLHRDAARRRASAQREDPVDRELSCEQERFVEAERGTALRSPA